MACSREGIGGGGGRAQSLGADLLFAYAFSGDRVNNGNGGDDANQEDEDVQ